jgi:hypothetical protein
MMPQGAGIPFLTNFGECRRTLIENNFLVSFTPVIPYYANNHKMCYKTAFEMGRA